MATNKKPQETYKIHVKTGDRVIVISGKDKGKIGNVKKAMPVGGKVLVEGVNIVTKSVKANPQHNIQGGFVKLEAPMRSCKVMLYCQKCEKPTRIRHDSMENGKKTRVCKKCGEQFDI